jgi:esterase/lipase superfamily enzyme
MVRFRPLLCIAVAWLLISAAPGNADTNERVTAERGTPYLTLRNKTGKPAPRDHYGEGRGTLSAGFCRIREFNLDLLLPVSEVVPFRVPDEVLRLDEVREMALSDVVNMLAEGAASRAPLLYTHGFYIDFEKGCRRATLFQENAGLSGRFLWFSWPSDGSLMNYTRDEADLAWSVPEFADAIETMGERFGQGGFHLAGHSLGGRGVILALYEVANRNPGLRLGQLVLLAPDIDFDLFRKLLPRISPLVTGITLYVTEADRPLALSAQVHGYPRLGETGNDTSRLPGVEVIDVSGLPVRSASGHLYHIYNREVGEDLNQLLNLGLKANERRNLSRAGPGLWRLQPD